MIFPPKPNTDDERRSELLRLMSVRGHPNVYVLGCFARYVTIYAQQVRAINLIDALARSGVLTGESEVAVVGGGIAGLTAAAAAAVRGVRRADVFESYRDTMRLQRTSSQRYVHPFIYDWPNVPEAAIGEKAAKVRANLPLMDWEDDLAQNVVAKLDAAWDDVRDKCPGRLSEPRTDCGPIELGSDGRRPTLRVGADPAARAYDVVILAVGYGRDADGAFENYSYWNDSSIDGPDVRSDESWLVSGAGDGALTDLMRLCIQSFRHDVVIKNVDRAVRSRVGELLKEAETEAGAATADAAPNELVERRAAILRDRFAAVIDSVGAVLDATLPRRLFDRVILVAPEAELVAGRASLLNRFIAYYLHRRGRFELVPGRVVGDPESISPRRPGGLRFRVRLAGAPEPEVDVDHVVLRHGPRPALAASFEDVDQRCNALKRVWRAAPQGADWTREPMYDPRDFTPGAPPVTPLRIDFTRPLSAGARAKRPHANVDESRPAIRTIVVTGLKEPRGQGVRLRVEEALGRQSEREGIEGRERRAVDPSAIALPALEAFASPAAYERAVRALCEADVAVFDVTDFPSGVMVLLGIRSAVRRGVTITVSQTDPANEPLPFNLAALNPIRIGRKGDFKEIARAIEAGIDNLRTDPDAYLDLPTFDALRHVGDSKTIPASQQILFLCWFDQTYREIVSDALEQRLQRVFPGTNVVTTLDSRSPRLIEQRLYAEIRRTQLCIVEWTGFRPNVFFELGVRLAVSATDPVSILYRNLPALIPGSTEPEDPLTQRMKEFFKPIPFDVSDRSELQAHLEAFETGHGNARVAGAALSPGRTHRVVCEALHRAQEPGGREVHEFLRAAAERMAGPAVPEEGEFPVLFGEALAGQVQRASVEHLAAAWYYLDRRYRLLAKHRVGALSDADKPRLDRLRAVGQQLKDRLRNVSSPEDAALAAVVGRALARLEPEPPETDVVARVRWLKAQALSLRDSRGDVPDRDALGEALRTLENAEHLLRDEATRLASVRPAGEAPAQREREVLVQLPHVLGSKGGVLRSLNTREALVESIAAYEQGYEVERALARPPIEIPMSYNLVQRLVVRALLEPTALECGDLEVHGERLRPALEAAVAVVSAQLQSTRARDAWAAADLALLRTLLGGPEWEVALDRFLDGPPAPGRYVLTATRAVVGRLFKTCEPRGAATASVTGRLKFADDEMRIALDGRS